MTVRTRIVAVGALSLALLGIWASAQGFLQAQVPPQAPVVISGSDIGFQVERQRDGIPVGKIVVRIDGRWVEPQLSTGVRRLPN